MISRYKYYERVKDDVIGSHPGLLDVKALQELFMTDDDTYYTIPFQHQYRPDLICKQFYGTTSLQWLITYINNISDSPEGYFINRVLRIPNKETVREFL